MRRLKFLAELLGFILIPLVAHYVAVAKSHDSELTPRPFDARTLREDMRGED
jgi:hypothetical protein